MTTNVHSGSAKIYQFPLRGRFAASTYREEANAVSNLAATRVTKAVVGGAWYHEEAIQDADRSRKNKN